MNGRVYDYNLGKFLSVDPIIQSPGNSQSLNPYSYIMNNPLSGTDPSGYSPCDTMSTIEYCPRDTRAGKPRTIKKSVTGSLIKRKVGTIGKARSPWENDLINGKFYNNLILFDYTYSNHIY